MTRLVAAGSAQRVLAVYGVSGLGKTALLRHVHERGARGSTQALVDVQDLVDGFSFLPGAGEDLAGTLLRELGLALASGTAWWRRRRARKLAAQIGGQRQGLGVRMGQVALWNSTISSSPITAAAGGPLASARRAPWVDDLIKIAVMTRRRRLLLLIDSTEWLFYFDDVVREQGRPAEPLGVGSWFISNVLVPLLDAAPRLKVVLAGQDRLALDRIPARRRASCELAGWPENHTAEYLARLGLPDARLARMVHRECAGMPLLAWLLARACQDWLADGARVDAAWLAGQARDRPLSEWFPVHVLDRLTSEQRQLMQACAVLRTITQGALEALVVGTALSPGWMDSLQRHYLLERIPVSGQAGRWRMHTLIRSWFLDYQECVDADRIPAERVLTRYHQRAAAYYQQLAQDQFSPEAAYHSFACGDPAPFPQWHALIIEALQTGGFERALTLAEVASVPGLAETLPAVQALACHARAYVAYRQGRLEDALEDAQNAQRSYPAAALPLSQVRMFQLAGQIAWRLQDWQLARRSWQEALALPGEVTDASDHLTTLVAFAEAAVGCGELTAADEMIARAHQLAAESGPATVAPADAATRTPVDMPCVALASAPSPGQYGTYLQWLAGRIEMIRGQWDKADTLLEVAGTASQADNNLHLQAHIWCLRSELSAQRGDAVNADRFADNALNAARECTDPTCRVLALTAKGHALARRVDSGPVALADTRLAPGQTQGPLGSRAFSMSLNRMTEIRHERRLSGEYLTTAQALADELDDRWGEANALWGLGEVAWSHGDNQAATEHYTRALALYQQIGYRQGEASTLRGLGDVARSRGDYQAAIEHYTRALALYQQIGYRQGEASTLRGLGEVARMRGDYQAAIEHYTRALVLHQQIGYRQGEASTLWGLGEVARSRGDNQAATEHYTRALALYQQIGYRPGEASSLEGLAELTRSRGDNQAAIEHYTRALVLYQQVGNRQGEASALWGLGEVAWSRGDYQAAIEHYTRALSLYQQVGDRRGEANALWGLGEVARSRGDYQAATEHYTRALSLYQQVGHRQGEASTLRGLGEVARLRGDHQAAIEHHTRALSLHQQIGHRQGEANALWSGKVARSRRDYQAATEHYTPALFLHQQVGHRQGEANALWSLGEVARSRGDYQGRPSTTPAHSPCISRSATGKAKQW